MNKVIIIAEAGVNHNGKLSIAKKLVDIAVDAGVDYIKFQTWITENVLTHQAPKADYQKINDDSNNQFNMAKNLELSFSDFKELFDYCNFKKIKFLSTPEEIEGLNFLSDVLNIPIIKIGSGELNNLVFLNQVGRKKKDVILSTGMGTLEEIKIAYSTLMNSGAKSVKILHCTTDYPASFNELNLKAILSLQKEFNVDIGYSDHSLGIEASIAAVALGSKIIEKHFTVDKKMKGPDHSASLDPDELREFVSKIRNIEKALSGDGIKRPQNSEYKNIELIRKGLYLSRNIIKGEELQEADLYFKRPVKSLSADKALQLLGKKFVRDLPKNHCLELSDFNI
jgi:N,N'-diacetyllegionaminate synthase